MGANQTRSREASSELVAATTKDKQPMIVRQDDAVGSHEPWTPAGIITHDLSSPLKLVVYDQRRRRVRTLLAGVLAAGERLVGWDGRDNTGRAVPNGVYFVHLTQDHNVRVQRVTVIT